MQLRGGGGGSGGSGGGGGGSGGGGGGCHYLLSSFSYIIYIINSVIHIMNSKLVLAVVIILLLLYVIFKALTTNYATLGTMQPSKNETTLKGDTLPQTIKVNSAISIWFYVKEWVANSNIVRFQKGTTTLMSVKLHANKNNIIITPRSDAVGKTCDIADFPLQKWVNLIVSFNGAAMDVYLDGKLIKSCVVDRGSELNTTDSIILGDTGKDFGFITNVKLKSSPVAPQEAWDIYSQGFGGSPWSDMLNKYKVKISFLVDNQEQTSVST